MDGTRTRGARSARICTGSAKVAGCYFFTSAARPQARGQEPEAVPSTPPIFTHPIHSVLRDNVSKDLYSDQILARMSRASTVRHEPSLVLGRGCKFSRLMQVILMDRSAIQLKIRMYAPDCALTVFHRIDDGVFAVFHIGE